MTGFQSKKAAALDEEGMYLVHQTEVKTQYPSEMYDREREQQIKAQSLTQPAQEPVAWMNKHGDCKSAVFREAEAGAKEEYNIPLYTNQILEKNT